MSGPLLDLIIAVHSLERPIRRAVESAAAGMTADRIRITIVCHNLPAAQVRDSLADYDYDSALVRLIEYADERRSPSGPFNEGLGKATGRYVAIMGSDDFFESGALPSLLDHAEQHNSDVVLVTLRHQGGEKLRNPLPRLRRSRQLDPVRDRLFYRSAPLGLLRRDVIEHENLRLTEGMAVGGDLAFSTLLWSSAARIDFPRGVPAYVIGADSGDRVTMQPRPISQTMAPVRDLLARDPVDRMPHSVRLALAVKILRIHVLGAATSRPRASQWGPTDAVDLAAIVGRLLLFAPAALRPFSRSDRLILDAIVAPSVSGESIVAAVEKSRKASRSSIILPRNPLRAFSREGTLVRYFLYRIDR